MQHLRTRSLVSVCVATALLLGASAASAGGPSYAKVTTSTSPSMLQHVGDRTDYGWHNSKRRYRHDKGNVVVEAPFTYVETGRHRHTAVDAPFTSVRVGRRGVWVRAPFVDIYVPH